MKKDGENGSSTLSGLKFENSFKPEKIFEENGFSIKKGTLKTELIVEQNGIDRFNIFKKHDLYLFIKRFGLENCLSKKLLPDLAIYDIVRNVYIIIEMKYQDVAGSVDEKLQTCDFKKQQYIRLLRGSGVEYCYLLNDWFRQESYSDVLRYIIDRNCYYFFNTIDFDFIVK